MIRLDYNEESQGNASNYPALLYTRRKKNVCNSMPVYEKKKKKRKRKIKS